MDHEHEHLRRRSRGFAVAALLLISLFGRSAVHAECSLGLGGIFYRHESIHSERAPVASFGCDVRRFDLRVRYFAPQEVTRERPWGPTRYTTNAHVGLSAMRMWMWNPAGRFQPVLGAGLLFKSSDSPRKCELSAPDGTGSVIHCHGDPWVPLPVEVSLAAGVAGDHWSLNLTHVSNAYLASYNWGQNFIELRYHW
jgi:hypothetical protein